MIPCVDINQIDRRDRATVGGGATASVSIVRMHGKEYALKQYNINAEIDMVAMEEHICNMFDCIVENKYNEMMLVGAFPQYLVHENDTFCGFLMDKIPNECYTADGKDRHLGRFYGVADEVSKYSEQQLGDFVICLGKLIFDLHESGFILGDILNDQNLYVRVVGGNLYPYIIDTDSLRKDQENPAKTYHSPNFVPPEGYDSPSTKESDIYKYCLIVCRLFAQPEKKYDRAGFVLFEFDPEKLCFKPVSKVTNDCIDRVAHVLGRDFFDKILAGLSEFPDRRPSIEEIMQTFNSNAQTKNPTTSASAVVTSASASVSAAPATAPSAPPTPVATPAKRSAVTQTIKTWISIMSLPKESRKLYKDEVNKYINEYVRKKEAGVSKEELKQYLNYATYQCSRILEQELEKKKVSKKTSGNKKSANKNEIGWGIAIIIGFIIGAAGIAFALWDSYDRNTYMENYNSLSTACQFIEDHKKENKILFSTTYDVDNDGKHDAIFITKGDSGDNLYLTTIPDIDNDDKAYKRYSCPISYAEDLNVKMGIYHYNYKDTNAYFVGYPYEGTTNKGEVAKGLGLLQIDNPAVLLWFKLENVDSALQNGTLTLVEEFPFSPQTINDTDFSSTIEETRKVLESENSS